MNPKYRKNLLCDDTLFCFKIPVVSSLLSFQASEVIGGAEVEGREEESEEGTGGSRPESGIFLRRNCYCFLSSLSLSLALFLSLSLSCSLHLSVGDDLVFSWIFSRVMVHIYLFYRRFF